MDPYGTSVVTDFIYLSKIEYRAPIKGTTVTINKMEMDRKNTEIQNYL